VQEDQDESDHPDRQALSRTEIDALKRLVDFQSHTVTHPILTACSDEKAEHEIVQSKRKLEEQYSLSIQALAFPNGDYGEREIALARKAGYACALSMDCGLNDERTDLFRLRRIPLPDEASVHELLVKTSDLWDLFRFCAQVKRRIKCGVAAAGQRTRRA
jgi:peptidoglycan/xylan/chitin deacetylase (PgdA/CDA1 family)